jgi:hypothetical protein
MWADIVERGAFDHARRYFPFSALDGLLLYCPSFSRVSACKSCGMAIGREGLPDHISIVASLETVELAATLLVLRQ